jgi:hypothetical protein
MSDARRTPSSEVLAALDDPASFRRAVRGLPSIHALIPLLAQHGGPPFAGSFQVRQTLGMGRPGLWLATATIHRGLPRAHTVPWHLHERWDLLVEAHRERAETPWLVGALLAAMAPRQERLARRTLLAAERRFTEEGRNAILEAVDGAPLSEVVHTLLGAAD